MQESGFALLERLRQETLAIPWGEGLLRIPLDADALGLLAAALGALRLRSGTQADRSMTAALEEARQRLWLTIPLRTSMAWWVGRSIALEECGPLLRQARFWAQTPGERAAVDRLSAAILGSPPPRSGDALYCRSTLADLARLTDWAERTPTTPRLRALPNQLVDPLVRERSAIEQRPPRATAHRPREGSHQGTIGRASTRAGLGTAQRSTESTPPPGQPASVLRRGAAAAVDLLAFTLLFSFFAALGNILFTGGSPGIVILSPGLYDFITGLGSLVVPLALTYGYWIYPVGRWGATLGKRTLSLRVVNPRGEPPGQMTALGRALFAGSFGWLLLLPWWPVPFREDRRGMHDQAASVWVIHNPID